MGVFTKMVSIVQTGQGIRQGLTDAVERIGGFAPYMGRTDRILLKPNLNGVEGFTNIKLVEALIQMLLDSGMTKIFMAESTYGDDRVTDGFFKKTGYSGMAQTYGIELVNLNRSQAIEVKVARPMVMETLRIAREALEADRIINLPNMKVHYATGITLALKNMKGILVGDEKKRFHEAGLDKAIVDLNNTIKPSLNIVDGIVGMERMGPRGGDPVDLGLIMAGGEAGEVDCVGSRIMGYSVDEVKHLKYYLEGNNLNADRIETVGVPPDAARHPFKKVRMDGILPSAFRIHDRNACSACQNAFLLSCQFLQAPPKREADVFMGGSVKAEASAEGLKIGFGNCRSGDVIFDQVIPGCPPYPFALREYWRTIEPV
jgi:uncharacterized protein (DUF362 family)